MMGREISPYLWMCPQLCEFGLAGSNNQWIWPPLQYKKTISRPALRPSLPGPSHPIIHKRDERVRVCAITFFFSFFFSCLVVFVLYCIIIAPLIVHWNLSILSSSQISNGFSKCSITEKTNTYISNRASDSSTLIEPSSSSSIWQANHKPTEALIILHLQLG